MNNLTRSVANAVISVSLLLGTTAAAAVAQAGEYGSDVSPESWHGRGMALLADGTDESRDSAIVLFHRAIEAELDYAPAYTALSLAYNAKAPWDGGDRKWVHLAIAFGEKAVFLAPADPDAHMVLGDAYLTKRWYRQALPHYRRFQELRPGVDSAHFSIADGAASLGWIWLEMGDNGAAIEWFTMAFSLDETMTWLPHYIGDMERVLGNTARAETLLKGAIEAYPEDRGVQASHLLLLLQERRLDDAIRHGNALLDREPENVDFLTTAATAYWYAGRDSVAIALFERALETAGGEDPDIEWWGTYTSTALAHLYQRVGRDAEAAVLLDRSEAGYRGRLHDAGEGWGYLYDLARVQSLRGDRDEAFRWLELATRFGFSELYIARVEPIMAELRHDPEFERILAGVEQRMGEQRRRMRR